MKIGKIMRKYMAIAGLDTAGLSQKTGLDEALLMRLDSGVRAANHDLIKSLGDILGPDFVLEIYGHAPSTKQVPTMRYTIPITISTKKLNAQNKKEGTNLRSTSSHLAEFFDKLDDAIMNTGHRNGWVHGDAIKVRVFVDYEQENPEEIIN